MSKHCGCEKKHHHKKEHKKCNKKCDRKCKYQCDIIHKDGYIVTDAIDTKIYYKLDGPKCGQVILMVHSLMTDHRTYNMIVCELQRKYLCLAIDLRGFGKSSQYNNPDLYKEELWVNDILAVINYFGYKNIVYLGTCFGAFLGTNLLYNHVNYFSKFVFVGPTPKLIQQLTGPNPWPYGISPTDFAGVSGLLPAQKEKYINTMNDIAYVGDRPQEYLNKLKEQNFKYLNDANVIAMMQTDAVYAAADNRNIIVPSDVPVFLFWGTKDGFFPNVEEPLFERTHNTNSHFTEFIQMGHPVYELDPIKFLKEFVTAIETNGVDEKYRLLCCPAYPDQQ